MNSIQHKQWSQHGFGGFLLPRPAALLPSSSNSWQVGDERHGCEQYHQARSTVRYLTTTTSAPRLAGVDRPRLIAVIPPLGYNVGLRVVVVVTVLAQCLA